MAVYNCSRKGLGHYSKWDVSGFYEDKFDDPLNFNLSENMVSLITAAATSISLILFADIMFRTAVRAKSREVSKEVVFRRHLFDQFSNPLNLLSLLVDRIRSKLLKSTATEGEQDPELSRSSKRTFYFLIVIGLMTVLIEFVFIFLATNQNREYKVKLDQVPVFEFEDRGCERAAPPARDSCVQTPLTEKPGFNPIGYLQICESDRVSANPNKSLFASTRGTVQFALLDTDGVDLFITFKQIVSIEMIRIGVILETGSVYQGILNVSAQSILSAMLSRFERTNATIVNSSTSSFVGFGDGETQILHSSPTMGANSQTEIATVIVDVERVDLRETHLSYVLPENASEGDLMNAMFVYLQGVAHSIMFPTGTGRGVFVKAETKLYLDEVETPLAFYNRPWMGVLPSLIICGCLLLIWVFMVLGRVENGIDSRLAWKEFFRSTFTVEDFGKGSDETQEMCWRYDTSGNRSFGFSPRI